MLGRSKQGFSNELLLNILSRFLHERILPGQSTQASGDGIGARATLNFYARAAPSWLGKIYGDSGPGAEAPARTKVKNPVVHGSKTTAALRDVMDSTVHASISSRPHGRN